MRDASSEGGKDYYVIRESVAHKSSSPEAVKGQVFDAQVMKVHFHEKDGTNDMAYTVQELCHSEFKFEGDSKGFEGATSLRGKDGKLYLLGLCEGNYCSETRGREAGNGRVVVMVRVDDEKAQTGCLWKTVRVLELPPSGERALARRAKPRAPKAKPHQSLVPSLNPARGLRRPHPTRATAHATAHATPLTPPCRSHVRRLLGVCGSPLDARSGRD